MELDFVESDREHLKLDLTGFANCSGQFYIFLIYMIQVKKIYCLLSNIVVTFHLF